MLLLYKTFFASEVRQTFSPKALQLLVITGFNTDIEYNGVVYHVQTEDKGLDTPLILSLVYNRGTILASKRSPYNDLLLGSFSEKELSERLNRQHKLICAAIRAGRIDDLKQMNSRDAKQANIRQSDKEKTAEKREPVPFLKKIDRFEDQIELKPLANFEDTLRPKPFVEELLPAPPIRAENPYVPPIKKPEIALPKPEFDFDAPIEITDADLIIDDEISNVQTPVMPSEAVEILTDFSKSPANAHGDLFVELLNEVTFKGGRSHTVTIMAGCGPERVGLVGANIMIKVLGASFRPLIFHTKTDSNGVAIVTLQIPQFNRGRAAVLFRAMSNGEEVELRRVIYPG